MEVRKASLISRHIVLQHHRHPVFGIILVQGEYIADVVVPDQNCSVEDLARQYEDWSPEVLEDLYISPGLIDCNVRVNGEWEGYRCLTKAAISGGVTMLLEEPSIYDLTCRDSELYCDVGKAFLATNSNAGMVESALDDVFAVKGYLSPPSGYTESIDAALPRLLAVLSERQVPLLLDAYYPSQRHIYMGSPCRYQTLEQRATFSGKSDLDYFAGAFPDDDATPEVDSDSPGSAPKDSFLRTKSDLTDIKKVRLRDSTGKNSLTTSQFPSVPEEGLSHKLEAQTVTLHKQKKRQSSLPKIPDIYQDLDARIKKTEGDIEDLADEEYRGYNAAGQTLYQEEPLRKRSSSFATYTLLSAAQSAFAKSPQLFPEDSPSRCEETGGFQERLKGIRPLALSIKKAPEEKVEDNRDKAYKRHLANFPDKWERTGIDFLVDFLKGAKCHVHFCNMVSTNAINRVRNLHMKTVTCETCPHYLYFTSDSIHDGATILKTCPPVRNKGNNELLWELLKMKGIDLISSHHTPVHPSNKFPETGNFRKAVSGITGLGFTLQSVWTRLSQTVTAESREHYIVRLSKWLSLHPARMLGISSLRGSIEKGKFADFVVWAPGQSEVVQVCYSQYPVNCPYMSHTLWGKIRKVYLRGQAVFDQGTLLAKGRRLYRSQFA